MLHPKGMTNFVHQGCPELKITLGAGLVNENLRLSPWSHVVSCSTKNGTIPRMASGQVGTHDLDGVDTLPSKYKPWTKPVKLLESFLGLFPLVLGEVLREVNVYLSPLLPVVVVWSSKDDGWYGDHQNSKYGKYHTQDDISFC